MDRGHHHSHFWSATYIVIIFLRVTCLDVVNKNVRYDWNRVLEGWRKRNLPSSHAVHSIPFEVTIKPVLHSMHLSSPELAKYTHLEH